MHENTCTEHAQKSAQDPDPTLTFGPAQTCIDFKTVYLFHKLVAKRCFHKQVLRWNLCEKKYMIVGKGLQT